MREFQSREFEPGDRWRAVYACRSSRSRGRLVAEPASPTRSEFQRDRDRIIHSTAFRRLKHKTQVFVSHEGDHFRTRLTHTIEVAQIARALARALGLDEDLAEALALAHDLGHTCFGHTGEDALDACMSGFGGFDHNAQTLRIVTRLERRYAGFDGLNLSWETLEGLVKHNGPLLRAGWRADRALSRRPASRPRSSSIRRSRISGSTATPRPRRRPRRWPTTSPTTPMTSMTACGRACSRWTISRVVPFLAELLDEIERLHPGLEPAARHQRAGAARDHPLRRGCAGGVAAADRARSRRQDADAIRRAGAPVIAFSDAIAAADREIKAFLYPNMYRHPRISADPGPGGAGGARSVRALHRRARGAAGGVGATAARASTRHAGPGASPTTSPG